MIVATPTSTHFACAQCAVGRDVHRFVEKPLTLSPAESRALSELAHLITELGIIFDPNQVREWAQD